MGESPLVVVGTPGSGTRVFARLAEAAGVHMGALKSEANDALALFHLADRWCPTVYSAWAHDEPIRDARFEADLRESLRVHLSEARPEVRWGWKQPRSLYLLPALHAAYPEMRVVHVIRDGRDVAFSAEPNVSLSAAYTLPAGELERADPVKAAFVWDRPNRLAARFGEQRLGERYLRVRLEDVCRQPVPVAERLAAFIGAGAIAAAQAEAIVHTPASIGRWRSHDRELVAEIETAAAAGLQRFGYVSGDD